MRTGIHESRRCIDVTTEIAKVDGTLRKDLQGKGRKLKTPDALIIATAWFHGLTLVSRDSDMSFAHEMEIEAFSRREKMMKLREELLAVQEDRMAGR
ncbi:type II toxin-antitoxin system VapC family toxin [Paenibacillus lemnae]|uniref:type II toxin-antitoxin system VapC family toxin n=1 Tax=Paenibacillus lemnae TaxID=1330551 RepID=UPI0031B5DAAE